VFALDVPDFEIKLAHEFVGRAWQGVIDFVERKRLNDELSVTTMTLQLRSWDSNF
jgi:hypothetical protein